MGVEKSYGFEFLSKQKSKMLSKPLMVALGPAGRRQLVAVSRRNMGHVETGVDGIEHEPREEFRDYSYLRINAKNFPWGDGKHTLFFNEEALPLPGKGYIREEELHVPILITLRNLFNMKARWTTKVGDPPSHGWTPIPGVDDHHH